MTLTQRPSVVLHTPRHFSIFPIPVESEYEPAVEMLTDCPKNKIVF